MIPRARAATVAYYLIFVYVVVLCDIYPFLWAGIGVAIGAVVASYAIQYVYENYTYAGLIFTLQVCMLFGAAAWVYGAAFLNISWLICYFNPTNEGACDVAPLARTSNTAMLIVLACPLAMWVTGEL